MDHSFEEIRKVVLDILAEREKVSYAPTQYENLKIGVAEVFNRRDGHGSEVGSFAGRQTQLPRSDAEVLLEVFWGLFREGVITLGMNDANREFPFFRVSGFGRQLLDGNDAYFFHDVSSYEQVVTKGIPDIDPVTVVYLKEAMQAFRSGCILSATVMLGVATEHTFLVLLETIDRNPQHKPTFASVAQQHTILQKLNKFRNILGQMSKSLPPDVKEDLDTNFAGILSIIRNFRNQSGHPTGKVIDREQAYILLQLFVPYCKKMYKLIDHYS